MNLRSVAHLSLMAALLLPVLATAEASAAEPAAAAPAMPPPAMPPPAVAPPPPADGARFRGGIAAEAGALVVPGVVTLGVAGIQGQLGAQINNNFGVYAVPNLDIVFGALGGVNLAFAVIVDYTLDDNLTFGIGPDFGLFGALGSGGGSVAAAGGALYGARLHFSWNPVVSHDATRPRRKALAIGVDVRMLGGGAGFVSTDGASGTASVGSFVLAPQLTIGYQAF
jgi:hypothetical protein